MHDPSDRPWFGEIPYEEAGRGFALLDGHMAPLTEEDLAHLPLPTRRVIEILGFVPGQDIDPIKYGKPYCAGPVGPRADRPCALEQLVEAKADGREPAEPPQTPPPVDLVLLAGLWAADPGAGE